MHVQTSDTGHAGDVSTENKQTSVFLYSMLILRATRLAPSPLRDPPVFRPCRCRVSPRDQCYRRCFRCRRHPENRPALAAARSRRCRQPARRRSAPHARVSADVSAAMCLTDSPSLEHVSSCWLVARSSSHLKQEICRLAALIATSCSVDQYSRRHPLLWTHDVSPSATARPPAGRRKRQRPGGPRRPRGSAPRRAPPAAPAAAPAPS